MKTRLSYWENTYLFETNARVVALERDESGRGYLILDQTIFHPQGGGQPSDMGKIYGGDGSLDVISVRAIDGEIRHYVEGVLDVCGSGQAVSLSVDPERRLEHARLHTAGHVLAIVAMGMSDTLHAVKGKHFPGECSVEFEGAIECDSSVVIERLNEGLAQEIAQNWPIVSRVDSLTGVREVQIGEYASVRCGGTHVNTTGELGVVTVRKIKAKKGRVNVGYDCKVG